MNNEILKSMKERNNAMKAKAEVYAIEDLLLKMLKCYFKNKLMNFENEKLSARYEYLLEKIKSKYSDLERFKDLPEFDFNESIEKLKKFKADNIMEMEKISIHENAYVGEKFVKCNRCNGVGGLEHYKHVKAGICFKCEGSLVVMSKGFKKHMSLIENKKDDLPF